MQYYILKIHSSGLLFLQFDLFGYGRNFTILTKRIIKDHLSIVWCMKWILEGLNHVCRRSKFEVLLEHITK